MGDMPYATRIDRQTAERIIALSEAAGKLLDGQEDGSTLTLRGYGEAYIARWNERGDVVVDLVRDN